MDFSITTDYAGFKKEKEKNETPNLCCYFFTEENASVASIDAK